MPSSTTLTLHGAALLEYDRDDVKKITRLVLEIPHTDQN